MYDHPSVDQDLVDNRLRETREHEQTVRALCDIARTHLDLLMGKQEWEELGLHKIFPDRENPDGFHWTIYVIPEKGQADRKRVGIKFFDAKGLLDIYEVSSSDSTLTLSDTEHQTFIDEEMNAPARAEQKEKDRLHQEMVTKIEEERGFPAGDYTLIADFPIREGNRHREILLSDFSVKELETREEVFKRARGEAVITGLHNYQLDVSKGYAIVTMILQRVGVPDVSLKVNIDANGHIPFEADLERWKKFYW